MFGEARRTHPASCLIKCNLVDLEYPECRDGVQSICFESPAVPETLSCALWFSNLTSLSAVGIGVGDGDLRTGMFPNGIERIDFSDNALTMMSDWSCYGFLRELRMDNNAISQTGNMKLPKFVTKLSLAGNQLETFPEVSDLEYLDCLVLAHNRLRKVPCDLPLGLRELNLACNFIETLPDFHPREFRRMEVLDLSENPVSSCIPCIAESMPNLVELSVFVSTSYFSLKHLKFLNSIPVPAAIP